ncbi:hypothetical protein L6452_43458 [Arctium lappa]|uniref:Uncharacterized protein n=1 Tax=Arctium lappa TaxID=4217 RepID=A0ACB8XDB2_ARCLA|nr:hypothetical protein L6452_43458 [Arctium lappa]
MLICITLSNNDLSAKNPAKQYRTSLEGFSTLWPEGEHRDGLSVGVIPLWTVGEETPTPLSHPHLPQTNTLKSQDPGSQNRLNNVTGEESITRVSGEDRKIR